eukprot:6133849-Amphidinium_carterae.1
MPAETLTRSVVLLLVLCADLPRAIIIIFLTKESMRLTELRPGNGHHSKHANYGRASRKMSASVLNTQLAHAGMICEGNHYVRPCFLRRQPR